jgi:hypothetical protein
MDITSKKVEDKFDAMERFWLGPKNPKAHVLWHGQKDSTQQKWIDCEDGTVLDGNYSEFSVRLHDPKARSLSFIYRTIAIIPKSRIRSVVRLLQMYLDMVDKLQENK